MEFRAVLVSDGEVDGELDELRRLGIQRSFFVLNIEKLHLLSHKWFSFPIFED
jgi:hypothetical protein